MLRTLLVIGDALFVTVRIKCLQLAVYHALYIISFFPKLSAAILVILSGLASELTVYVINR